MGVQYNLSYHSYEVTTDHVTIHVQFMVLRVTWVQAIISAYEDQFAFRLLDDFPMFFI